MKTSLDCVPCLLRQSLEAARAVTDDVGVQAHVVREVLQMLGALDLDRLPPFVAQAVHRRIHVLTGVEDPCRKAKMGRPRRYASVQAACEAAVAAEIANGGMYERLLTSTQRSDILNVLRNLQAASQQRHLPAFQRCAQGGGGGGGGRHRRGPGAQS